MRIVPSVLLVALLGVLWYDDPVEDRRRAALRDDLAEIEKTQKEPPFKARPYYVALRAQPGRVWKVIARSRLEAIAAVGPTAATEEEFGQITSLIKHHGLRTNEVIDLTKVTADFVHGGSDSHNTFVPTPSTK